MKTRQTGFTLIELIIVIIILGILAATAMPKFIDFSEDAEKEAVKAVAAAITEAGAINYGKKKLGTGGVDIKDANDACVGDSSNGTFDSVLENIGVLLTGNVSLVTTAPNNNNEYMISAATALKGKCSAGTTIECTIKGKNNKTATAYVPCTN